MNKKYWYYVSAGIGVIVLFAMFIFVFRKESVKENGIKVREFIQKNKDLEALDLVAKTFVRNKPDYKSVGELGGYLVSLPLREVNKVFYYALDKYPQYTNELKIGWAWVLSRKGKCKEALNKIKKINVTDHFWNDFWKGIKQDIVDKCKVK